MRLLRCRKCGEVITTQGTMVENMLEEVKRLNRLAENDAKYNKGRLTNVYQQQSSQINKLMKQIIHLTGQMDEAFRRVNMEHKALVGYILQNGIMTESQLVEIEQAARARVEEANRQDQKKIAELYGEFESICQNRTKRDPTAKGKGL